MADQITEFLSTDFNDSSSILVPKSEQRRIIFLKLDMNNSIPDDRHFILMAKTAKGLGHDVSLVTNNTDTRICEVTSRYMPIYQVGSWIPKTIFGRFFSGMHVLRTFYTCFWIIVRKFSMKPTLIVTHTINSAIPLLKVFGNMHVIQLQTYPERQLVERMFKRFEPIWNPFHKFCIECADEVVVPNKIAKMIFNDFYEKTGRRASVVYPCVETFIFEKCPTADISNFIDIPKDAIFFVQFEAQRLASNFEMTVTAFLEMIDTIRPITNLYEKLYLIIIGRFAETEEYMDYLERVNYVMQYMESDRYCVIFQRFSPVHYRKALLARCVALIHPTLYDTNPHPILEAGMMKKPVIATKTGISAELIIDGVNGFFIDQDPTEYAKCMYSLLLRTDMTEEWSQKTYMRFKKHFGMVRFAQEVRDLVERNTCHRRSRNMARFTPEMKK